MSKYKYKNGQTIIFKMFDGKTYEGVITSRSQLPKDPHPKYRVDYDTGFIIPENRIIKSKKN